MSSEEYNGKICRCCHSEGKFQSLDDTIAVNKDAFVDMLHSVLDVHMIKVKPEMESSIWSICPDCIQKVIDADNFKQQVLTCERVFRDLYAADLIIDQKEKKPRKRKIFTVPIVEEVVRVADINIGGKLQMEVYDDDVIEIKDEEDETPEEYLQQPEAPTRASKSTRQLRKREPKTYTYGPTSKEKSKTNKNVSVDADTSEEAIKDEEKLEVFEIEFNAIEPNVDNEKAEDISDDEVNNDVGAADISDIEIASDDEVAGNKVAGDKAAGDEGQASNGEDAGKESSSLLVEKKKPKKPKQRNLYLGNKEDITCDDALLFADIDRPKHVLEQKITNHPKLDHLGIKEHRCNECSDCFSDEIKLLLHKHKHVKNESRKAQKIMCEICFEQFTTKAGWAKHQYEVHDIDQRYKCKECSAAFFYKNRLAIHFDVFHKEVKRNQEKNVTSEANIGDRKENDNDENVASSHDKVAAGDRDTEENCGKKTADVEEEQAKGDAEVVLIDDGDNDENAGGDDVAAGVNKVNYAKNTANVEEEQAKSDVEVVMIDDDDDKDAVEAGLQHNLSDNDKEQVRSDREVMVIDDEDDVVKQDQSKVIETKEKHKKPKHQYHSIRNEDIMIVDGLFKCAYCPKKHNLRKNMRLHVTNMHLRIKENQCDKCPESFSEEDHLLLHKHYKHYLETELPKKIDTNNSCDICLERFSMQATMLKHKYEVHNIDLRFKCNACDGAYYNKRLLQNHLNTFHKLGPLYKCQTCDYETHSATYMHTHKNVHLNNRKFKCKYCQKSFKSTANRHQHEMIHTGVRRKVCKECGKAFVQKASLNYHMTKYHPGVPF